jgi:hypothetical protein
MVEGTAIGIVGQAALGNVGANKVFVADLCKFQLAQHVHNWCTGALTPNKKLSGVASAKYNSSRFSHDITCAFGVYCQQASTAQPTRPPSLEQHIPSYNVNRRRH